jgi:hypothetical protein
MLEGVSRKVRRVVPRWMSTQDSMRLGNLQGKKTERPLVTEEHFTNTLKKWESNNSQNNAIELVTIYNAFGDACSLSKADLKSKFESADDCELAIRLLEVDYAQNRTCITPESSFIPKSVAGELKKARDATRRQPRDALAWLALARCYTLCGLQESLDCERAIVIACQLAPNNRYVVRASVRYFLHRNRPDKAIDLLLKSRRTTYDPWMASALIASRAIANAPQKSIRTYSQLANDLNWSTYSRSELLSGLGTLEANSGAGKVAKNFFNKAVSDPTENALAQAQWFSHNHKYIT